MELILSALPEFLRGAGHTLIYCGLAFPLALLLGLVLALMSGSTFPWLKVPARLFIEVMRGTPIITQIVLLYYGVGAILLTVDLSALVNVWVAGVTALALNYTAYAAEVYRAGFQSVDRGQQEAALSLGMTGWQSFYRIIFPQAIPLMIPPFVNDFIYMLKDSAVLSIIAGGELTAVLQSWTIRHSSNPLPLFLLAILLYLALSLPTSYLGRYLERRLRAAL